MKKRAPIHANFGHKFTPTRNFTTANARHIFTVIFVFIYFVSIDKVYEPLITQSNHRKLTNFYADVTFA